MRTGVVLVPVGGGALALTHRPKLKALPAFKGLGATHVVTLLAEREGAKLIGDATTAASLIWLWTPLENGNVPGAARTAELKPRLQEIAAIIAAGGKAVVHCSAGIHRTGMIGYALLRLLGLPADDARAKLADLRGVTAEGVGDDRVAWGDSLVPQEPGSDRRGAAPDPG